MAGKVFISYRRGDEPGFAHALYARLEQAFSTQQVFMDVEGGIPAGADFVEVLEAQIARCDVLLTLIGKEWLNATDETGARRLDQPDDFVRLEIESALRLGKRVIPILINWTEMPRMADLPAPLQPLARRNAIRLTQERFRADVQALIAAIEDNLRQAEPGALQHATKGHAGLKADAPTRRLLLYGLGGATSLAAAGGLAWMLRPTPHATSEKPQTASPGAPLPDTTSDSSILTMTGHSGPVYSVAFSSDRRVALSGSGDRTLKLWLIATGNALRTFTGHGDGVISVTFSPDAQTALSASADKTLKLWEVASGQELRTFIGHSDEVSSVAFSPDGRTALSGSADKTLKLWDVASAKALRTFTRHLDTVDCVAFSPDGGAALSGSGDGTLTLWNVATGSVIRAFTGHLARVNSVQFSADGRTALSGSADATLKLWDVATGNELRTFKGHAATIFSAAFTPDGRTALSGSADTTLKLWEVASGKTTRTASEHQHGVLAVAVAPDGRFALSGSSDATLKIWALG